METTVYVAIPKRLADAISSPHRAAEVDLTALLEEWATGFVFPTEALIKRARQILATEADWKLRARATVTPATTRLLRDAATHDEVLKAVAGSELAWLLDETELKPQATCLLLGLAALTALEAEVGREARRLNAEAERRAATRSARQQSDAQARPTLASVSS